MSYIFTLSNVWAFTALLEFMKKEETFKRWRNLDKLDLLLFKIVSHHREVNAYFMPSESTFLLLWSRNVSSVQTLPNTQINSFFFRAASKFSAWRKFFDDNEIGFSFELNNRPISTQVTSCVRSWRERGRMSTRKNISITTQIVSEEWSMLDRLSWETCMIPLVRKKFF